MPILCLDEESPTASGRTSTICDGNLGCDPVGGSDVNGELAGVLGRLTRGGQVGTRALHGVVGVRCEGENYEINTHLSEADFDWGGGGGGQQVKCMS